MSDRKVDHLALCTDADVGFQGKTNLLEQVKLMHCSLPELAVDDVSLQTNFVGARVNAPIMIAAMTGGTERANQVNRDLAIVAEELGLAMGFGSMRPLLEQGNRHGYFVRDVAPNAVLLGNIGVVQARGSSTEQLNNMIGETGVNALCVHLNPAQEMVQPEGDVDFRGGLDTLARLISELDVPVVVKETGCGISREVGRKLADIGARWVDCSGAGGTSWVAVETLRARARSKRLGELFWDWGIPTAASVAQLSGLGLRIVATGGVQTGLDVARAMALGAQVGGLARPFLIAQAQGGSAAVKELALGLIDELRVACLLCGVKRPVDLDRTSLVLGPELAAYVPKDSPLHQRM